MREYVKEKRRTLGGTLKEMKCRTTGEERQRREKDMKRGQD